MIAMRFTVDQAHTARALGSGDLDVLGTPQVLAWIEQATVVAAQPWVEPTSTSVGVEVRIRHLRASPVGAEIEVVVLETTRTQTGEHFEVVVREIAPNGAEDVVVAEGQILRVIVDRERFLSRLKG
jgi:fluoroacetyl-CoA thioesterase